MEINKENFAEAIKSEEFKNTLLPLIAETDDIKTIVTNKADSIYREKIDDEVKKIHSGYDDDMFSILGERPGQTDDGAKEKTYAKAKALFGELKDLRTIKDSLTKDAEVLRLTGEIEKLKTEGGAKHVQEMFDKAKSDWEQKELDLKTQIESSANDTISFKKRTEIQNAIQQIKFNPDTPESIRKLVVQQAENQMIENSKFEGDKFIVLDKDGKPSLDGKYQPQSAFDALMSLDAIKDISLKPDQNNGGGGADPKFNGSIQTKSVDGNDTKKLILPEGSFKSKMEFQDVANKALMTSGISKSHKDYTVLIDEAYNEYKVAELPIK